MDRLDPRDPLEPFDPCELDDRVERVTDLFPPLDARDALVDPLDVKEALRSLGWSKIEFR